MERLWSPWRRDYVVGHRAKAECVFCSASNASDSGSLVVHQGSASYVILNLYPYNNGHLMVVPYRHVASLGALTTEELQEVALLTQRSETVLTEAYRPQGLNVGINLGKTAGAGILEHVHVHVVPRWDGDTNFMTVVGNMRVLPEELGATVARLRPIFRRLAAGGAHSDGDTTR